MITNFKKYILDAWENKCAIGAFNTCNIEITRAVIAAAEELKAPIFIQTSQNMVDYEGANVLADMIKNEADKISVPISMHLDHGKNIETVKKCLELGYASVMIDGSSLTYEENVKVTKEVVQIAKQCNALVEGEIGVIGKECSTTDPEIAKKFVSETGVDMLAVAFGNAHGIPDADEKLDFEVLSKINQLVKIPLVFHGASSTKLEDIKKAIDCGIAKINIDTDIKLAFSGEIKEFQDKNPDVYDPRKIFSSAQEDVKKVVLDKIKQFGYRGEGKCLM